MTSFEKEVVGRCLAAISKKVELVSRSLLTSIPHLKTLKIIAQRAWVDIEDVRFWVRRIASNSGLILPRKTVNIRLCLDKRTAVFDLPEMTANALLHSNALVMYEKDYTILSCETLPPLKASGSV